MTPHKQNTVKMALIGAGVFGQHYLRKCISFPSIDFIGFYDTNTQNSQNLATQTKQKFWPDLSKLLAQVDAVIIASPAQSHAQHALQALQANCHVLIEKPMCTSIQDGEAIISYALEHNLRVQVGHQERFVVQACGLDTVEVRPLRAHFIRHCMAQPSSALQVKLRGHDVSVCLDLMTHDLDLALWLWGQDAGFQKIECTASPSCSYHTVQAWGHLTSFELECHFSSNRLARQNQRSLHLIYPPEFCQEKDVGQPAEVQIDFLAKTIYHNTVFTLTTDFGENLQARDSLGASLQAFVDSVIEGKQSFISPQDGLKAVQAALAIETLAC